MILKKVSLLFILFLTLVITLINTGCKKKDIIKEIKADTVYDTIPAPPLAANRILEYEVTNTQDQFYCAINDSLRTITVYLPYYFSVTVIEPGITLPAGTTISPASGDLINVFDTSTTYTVTAKDGSTAVYKLNIIIQQPVLVLTEVSSATKTKSYKTGQVVGIGGQNFVPSPDVTKASLVGDDGSETPLTPELTIGNTVTGFWAIIPANVKPGSYKIKLSVYRLSKTMIYPVTITSS